MKLSMILLSTVLAFGTPALAQSGTTSGQSVPPVGSVTAPSVGSYYWLVGTTNLVPTWNNTTRSVVTSGVPTISGGRPAGMGR